MSNHNLLDLIPGQAELPEGTNDCGCCEGTKQQTPERLYNRPSLTAIAYRVGSRADFKRSMLARLSSAELPALARLRIRDDDDFSIALLDGWATVCDVLSFYQERNANEVFLGTATERRSIIELGRLIGYRLKPGLAASTDLVFLLNEPPGAPEEAVAETPIPVGTRVQSVPGPEETAQIFETVEALTARVNWNALQPRQSRLLLPGEGDLGTYITGVGSGLKVGDPILIVGRQRAEVDPGSEWWDFRRLTKVDPDPDADHTYIEWTHGLGSIDPPGLPAQEEHKIFALRLRASLFGYNAPNPKLLPERTQALFGLLNDGSAVEGDLTLVESLSLNGINEVDGEFTLTELGLLADGNEVVDDWPFIIDVPQRRIFLDAIYSGIVEGSWVVLTSPQTYAELYKADEVTDDGLSRYALSGRSTRLTLDTDENLEVFESNYRKTSVYAQSEELGFAETPIRAPVWTDEVELAAQVEALEEGKLLLVRGRRAQLRVAVQHVDLDSAAEPGVTKRYLRGTRLTLLTVPTLIPGMVSPPFKLWRLTAPGGFEGFATAHDPAFEFIPADESAEFVAEVALLKTAEPADDTHSRLRLEAPLQAVFDRASTVIHANVAAATHGESTQEILGAGDASRPFQSFPLKQSPVTHVSSNSASGSESTLELRLDEVLWHEVPFLYGRGARERVFSTNLTDEGETVAQFGDGIQGSRLPTGQNNVVAKYRKGLGRAGSVAEETLSIALDKPLGLERAVQSSACHRRGRSRTPGRRPRERARDHAHAGPRGLAEGLRGLRPRFCRHRQGTGQLVLGRRNTPDPGHRCRPGQRSSGSECGYLRESGRSASQSGRSFRPGGREVVSGGDLQIEAGGQDPS